MICEHCGAFFCADYDDPDAPPRRYCDSRCQRNAKFNRNRDRRRRRAAPASAADAPTRRARQSLAASLLACARKYPYPDMDSAAESWRRRSVATGGIYDCPHGDHWHITSKDGEGVIVPARQG